MGAIGGFVDCIGEEFEEIFVGRTIIAGGRCFVDGDGDVEQPRVAGVGVV